MLPRDAPPQSCSPAAFPKDVVPSAVRHEDRTAAPRAAGGTEGDNQEAQPKSNRTRTMAACGGSCGDDHLADAEWYWGNTSRSGGSTRLVKILHLGGRFGFSEPPAFGSVAELVRFFRSESLARYNGSLDTRLLHPVSRYRQVGVDLEAAGEQLRRFQDNYREKSSEYDRLFEEFNQTSQELQSKRTAIEAIQTSSEELQSRVEEIHSSRSRLEEELRRKAAAHMEVEQKMELLKPDLLQLRKTRDQYLL
ncbi:Phosphatidylinositol 3-kinase regulatory subunit alpha [Liparis tanakae]|uniref:Phosphatidylinositol 3-kinase regulatory subunit alpha n=1 Tax=Liparis tanakae TaxID=230148 RepID=A0A4Z2FCI1_9TELE|nr:Phosphatidylinositol 3-kinase regulatory subunit alpha [Liparis tanakae]